MSLMPGNSEEPVRRYDAPTADYRQADRPAARLRWPYRAVWVVLFSILSFEIGLFLAVFPWMDYWTFNHLSGYFPTLESYWDDPYFKGAISGLGCVNLYISASQITTLLRRRKSS
jgi:hypothetical protein